jgi:hypothetical protein
MPHIPDSVHETHDLELIAAYAGGAGDRATDPSAAALVAACAGCADLFNDLRAIAAAMPALPVPARPRDFRLTPDQAAALRPRGLRGLVASLASPRFSFAAPLGTGLAALGIVGVLVASGATPFAGSGSAGTAAGTAPQVESVPDGVDQKAGALEAPSGQLDASPDPNLTIEAQRREDVTLTPLADAGPAAASTTSTAVLALGLVLVFVGAALVAARIVARGLARAP